MEAVEQADVQLIADYAELWLANCTRNQPIRLDGATLQAEMTGQPGTRRLGRDPLAWHCPSLILVSPPMILVSPPRWGGAWCKAMI
jgi:hypothetical protein